MGRVKSEREAPTYPSSMPILVHGITARSSTWPTVPSRLKVASPRSSPGGKTRSLGLLPRRSALVRYSRMEREVTLPPDKGRLAGVVSAPKEANTRCVVSRPDLPAPPFTLYPGSPFYPCPDAFILRVLFCPRPSPAARDGDCRFNGTCRSPACFLFPVVPHRKV